MTFSSIGIQMNKLARLFAAAALFVSLGGATMAIAADQKLPLKIGAHTISVEVASTPETRMKGLMHREKMGKNDGMVFVFDQIGYHGMWMKNTLIPLSVAFIDEQGKILNIADMEPHSEQTHSAAGPARYALEMNVGWFKARNISAGAVVKGLDKAPKPQ
jgi:uncharacterized membrane protein (UPF0127 family)